MTQKWTYTLRSISEEQFNHLQRLVEEDVVLRATPNDRNELLDVLGTARDGKLPTMKEGGHY